MEWTQCLHEVNDNASVQAQRYRVALAVLRLKYTKYDLSSAVRRSRNSWPFLILRSWATEREILFDESVSEDDGKRNNEVKGHAWLREWVLRHLLFWKPKISRPKLSQL
jgi:hypothetical protein